MSVEQRHLSNPHVLVIFANTITNRINIIISDCFMTVSSVNFYSIVAGVSACLASVFGKLTFSQPTFASILTIIYIILFIFSNVFMWRCYSKALSLSTTSIQPTIITKTTNFLLSALVGFIFFFEPINFTWIIGFLLILLGVYLISTKNDVNNTQISSHID